MFKNRKIALFDWSNLTTRCLFTPHVLSDNYIDYEMLNWTIWNSLFCTCVKLKVNACILATDCHSWRKIIYPAYKLNRTIKKQKEKDSSEPSIDWQEFYEKTQKFGLLLKDNLPFMFLSENSCEADDIIATLAINDKLNEYIIVSADSDYKQINENNVKLYDPLKSKFVEPVDHDKWINEYALKGQGKDNIYNIFTPVNFDLESKQRKPSFSSKLYDKIMEIGIDEWLDNVGPTEIKKKNEKIKEENEIRKLENKPLKTLLEVNLRERYKVNKKILDLYQIPQPLVNRILSKYNNSSIVKSDNFYPFFKTMNWRSVLEDYTRVEDFLFRFF